MNQKTIITILVVAVIILAGTTIYFSTNLNAPQPATVTSTDWKLYGNEKYGFGLTFPITWLGYNATNRTLDWGSLGTNDSIDFGLPSQKDGLFNISIHTKKQWGDIKSEGGPAPEYLGENEIYVFAWAQSQDAADSEMEERMKEVQDIVKTFKLNK